MKIRKDFTLKPETIVRLGELSEKYNQSRSEIIDRLIAENIEKDVAIEKYNKVKHELEQLIEVMNAGKIV